MGFLETSSFFVVHVELSMWVILQSVMLKKCIFTINTQKYAGGVGMSQMDNESHGGNISLLLDVPLKLTVELGRTTRTVKEILALAPGSVVELDKLSGEAVDILVNEKVIIEIKSVEALAPVHHKQLLTYLKLTNKKLGLLVNFNTDNISSSIIRIANNL